jgi:hypothetical protein
LQRKDLVNFPFDRRPFHWKYHEPLSSATLVQMRAMVNAGPVVVREWNSLFLNQIANI